MRALVGLIYSFPQDYIIGLFATHQYTMMDSTQHKAHHHNSNTFVYVEFYAALVHTLNANDSSVVPGCIKVKVALGDASGPLVSRVKVKVSSESGTTVMVAMVISYNDVSGEHSL